MRGVELEGFKSGLKKCWLHNVFNRQCLRINRQGNNKLVMINKAVQNISLHQRQEPPNNIPRTNIAAADFLFA